MIRSYIGVFMPSYIINGSYVLQLDLFWMIENIVITLIIVVGLIEISFQFLKSEKH